MEILTKKFIIIAASVLVIFLLGGFLAFRFIEHRSIKSSGQSAATNILGLGAEPTLSAPSPTPAPTPIPEATAKPSVTPAPESTPDAAPAEVGNAPSYNGSFQWGVTMRPNVLSKYNTVNWATQVAKAKQLGVGWARINWDYDNSDPAGRNAAVIDALRASGIQTLLVIEHNPAKGNNDLYGQGLADARQITGAVGSRVDYYQLANEGGAESLIGGRAGTSAADFDDSRYNNVRDYIKGLSDGIASGDPGAKRIVTISWVHTGFLDRLIGDNVNFDMIGIDWYSWMGSFGNKTISSNQTLYHKLQTFGKPLTFMEVSTMPTSDGDQKYKTIVDEDAQANFLTGTANWAWNNRDWVKGFYHFEFVDNTFSSGYTDYYGLVKVKDNGTALGDVRKAFGAYHDLISGK